MTIFCRLSKTLLKAIPLLVTSYGLLQLNSMADAALPKPTLEWDLTESGVTPTAIDSSGNHFDGTSVGNVTGNGTLFSKFNSIQSLVKHTWDKPFPTVIGNSGDLWIQDMSFVADISHPGISAVNLIARGGSSQAGGNDGWQVYLGAPDASGQRTVSLSIASWGGMQLTKTSTPFTMNPNATYQFACTWTYSNRDPHFIYAFNIYLTPLDSSSANLIFSNTINLNAGTPTGDAGSSAIKGDNSLVIGGGDNGYYTSSFPAGNFGGDIHNVKLYLGIELSPAQLSVLAAKSNDAANGILR
jgi:hypothetical protein